MKKIIDQFSKKYNALVLKTLSSQSTITNTIVGISNKVISTDFLISIGVSGLPAILMALNTHWHINFNTHSLHPINFYTQKTIVKC